MKWPLLIILILISISVFAQDRKDTIFFNNGTMVIGKLKKIRMGVVTFDPDDANDITVQLRKVRGLSAIREIYRVETIDRQVLYGIISPDTVPQFVKIGFGANEEIYHVEEIAGLYPFSNDFKQNFSGSIGLGYNYTRSSSFGRVNFDAAVNYVSKRHEASFTLSGIYSQTDSGFTRDREDLNIRDNYYFSSTSFITPFYVYQRNLEVGIDSRHQLGFGAGNKFITNKKMFAWARGGFVVNQEKSTEGTYSGLLTEAFAQTQFNLFKFTKPEVKLNFTQTVYLGLTDAGRVRTDGQIDLSWEIITDFKLSLQFYNNYDSRPPSAGVSNVDYGIVFGLKYIVL